MSSPQRCKIVNNIISRKICDRLIRLDTISRNPPYVDNYQVRDIIISDNLLIGDVPVGMEVGISHVDSVRLNAAYNNIISNNKILVTGERYAEWMQKRVFTDNNYLVDGSESIKGIILNRYHEEIDVLQKISSSEWAISESAVITDDYFEITAGAIFKVISNLEIGGYIIKVTVLSKVGGTAQILVSNPDIPSGYLTLKTIPDVSEESVYYGYFANSSVQNRTIRVYGNNTVTRIKKIELVPSVLSGSAMCAAKALFLPDLPAVLNSDKSHGYLHRIIQNTEGYLRIINSNTKSIVGTTEERPVCAVGERSFKFYDTDLKKPIFWDGQYFKDANNFFPKASSGDTRPTGYSYGGTVLDSDKGFLFFDTTLNRPIFVKEAPAAQTVYWVDADGYTPAAKKGTTAERPTSTLTSNDAGYMYFDIELGKPIWWNGGSWKDANGNDPDVV